LNKAKVGGLAGLNGGSILNAYATGGVSAGDSSDAGGLVGYDEFAYSGIIQGATGEAHDFQGMKAPPR
jgi:hypothetical protein